VAAEDPILADSIAGELISSEIEIRSGRGEDLADARAAQSQRRRRLFALASEHGIALGATGTHPWSDYRQQHVIDTEHYRRVEDGLKYVAWRNNTFSLHVHVGVRGADRAVLVCDRLRPVLPTLLAISASSPFIDGLVSGVAQHPDADLHAQLPALRGSRRLRRLERVRRLHRDAGQHSLDRRVHTGLVVDPASLRVSGRSRSGSATRSRPRPSPTAWRR